MVNPFKYIKMQSILNLDLSKQKQNNKDSLVNENSKFVLLFDIEDTLYYSGESKLAEKKYHKNLEEKLKRDFCDKKPFKSLIELKNDYGSSREGIFRYYETSEEFIVENDYNDIHKYIKRNDELLNLMDSIPFEKYCFSNAFPGKAKKILEKLEIEDYFNLIICSDDLIKKDKIWIAKPKAEAFRFIERYLEIDDETTVVFFDDKAENIEMAMSEEFQWISYQVTEKISLNQRLKQFKLEYLDQVENSRNLKATFPNSLMKFV